MRCVPFAWSARGPPSVETTPRPLVRPGHEGADLIQGNLDEIVPRRCRVHEPHHPCRPSRPRPRGLAAAMPKKILDPIERFAPRWSGSLTAVPCANTAVRPRDTPGSGKSRSLAETRPRHPDRTAPRHTKPPVRGTESLRLQTAVVVSSRPLARWGADPRDTYPNTSCLRLFSDRSRPPFAFGECGTFRTLVATSPQVAMVGSQEERRVAE